MFDSSLDTVRDRSAINKNLKRVGFPRPPAPVLTGVRQELSQDQGMARSIFLRQELTQDSEPLVTVEAIAVSVHISVTEISLVDAAVAETRVVVLRSFLVSSVALITIVIAPTAVFSALLIALVVTRI